MLVSVKEAAIKLNVSSRAIQIKCNKLGVKKIGNQYQITTELLNTWIESNSINTEKIEKTERNEREQTKNISHPKRNELRNPNSFIYKIMLLIVSIILISISILYYIDLNNQINDSKALIKENDANYKAEIKVLNNSLNDAIETIHRKDLQLQWYRMKDSLKYIKKSKL